MCFGSEANALYAAVYCWAIMFSLCDSGVSPAVQDIERLLAYDWPFHRSSLEHLLSLSVGVNLNTLVIEQIVFHHRST